MMTRIEKIRIKDHKYILTDDSMNADDFVIELPASFQFQAQSVDLAKLFVIRDKKTEKRNCIL